MITRASSFSVVARPPRVGSRRQRTPAGTASSSAAIRPLSGAQSLISAEVKKESEEKKGKRVLRSERYYGKVYRAFTLGQPVDDASAGAKYSDGVLELTLPKKAAVQAKRITIQ